MSEKYFVVSGSEKNKLEGDFDSLLFHYSWSEDQSKEHFECVENDNVIYIYELKEVHRRKKDSNSDVGVKEVWL